MKEVCDEWRVRILDRLMGDEPHVIAWIFGVQARKSWHKLDSLFHSTTEAEKKKMEISTASKHSELPYS